MAPVARLNQLLAEANSPPLTEDQSARFTAYLTLLQKWNARTNLTAIRDEDGILSRHFLESILAAHFLPENVSNLLDFGSGAGFPGLPIAILHPELPVTLAESQHKKAAFLREAVRTLALPNVTIHAARAETLPTKFACITLRAVDNMQQAISAAIQLLAPSGWLAILTTRSDAATIELLAAQSTQPKSLRFTWQPHHSLPPGTDRILLQGQLLPSS
ncbi:16S rRNA (guanine(527)-N(7))-methyltransferase RsmG [Acidicapsa dinghuensis]|uniref:Ribosomal RNA small subunit methyltransferase G n=1 Tax=Acidicapsa dinghuensis TaxID=2218256 RepID=A0ABW1E8R7_9BACT|nr:16S rRNA (guanine(527)-N(7))-methyltransferase RsmG [Acidicapsa dinghuensis]